MKTISINLPGSGAQLTGFLHDAADDHIKRNIRPCVVICPGGAYRLRASHEAEPVAMRFYTAGYQAFVLHYTVSSGSPVGLKPLRDASEALLAIRENSGEWRVAPDQIAICGFSAGGHLAASLGTLWNREELRATHDTGNGRNRPDALILCYPVILAGGPPHSQSIENLVGPAGDASLFSLENQVGAHTPPTFLWHTADDANVPVEHSLQFLGALNRQHIPFESHIYQSGPHGISLATPETTRVDAHIATWSALCIEWLDTLFAVE